MRPEINAAGNFAHALQRQVHLLVVTEEEMKYRIKQFGKCINSTNNHSDWQAQTYASKLRRRLMTLYAE